MKHIKIWNIVICMYLMIHNITYSVSANTVVATINVGTNPSGIAVTHDNSFVYVANSGSNTVSVINTSNNSVQTIDGFNTPYSVTINPANTLVYVTNSGQGAGQNTVSVIDIATNNITATIDGLLGPDAVVITPDGLTAYVANYGFPNIPTPGTTVSVVDLTTNLVTQQIPTGGQYVAALAISPNGQFVYAANYNTGNEGSGTISVIDTATNNVVTTIDGFFGPYTMVVTPDGNYLYVTNFGSNNFIPIGTTANEVNLATNAIVDTIPLGNQPAGLAQTPDGTLFYATNYNDANGVPGPGTVNLINATNNMVIAPIITVGSGPGAVAISPNGQFAYVSNYISNTVSVISLQSFQITAQGQALQNIFLTQKELVNQLTWSASGPSLPISYSIYHDAALTNLIATIPATTPLIYLDHDRQPNTTYTYYIVGTNAAGTTSIPVVVTITQNS